MKITVLGLWHLGCVTAACSAKHFAVTGLDLDAANIARLQSGKAPLFEPGLEQLLQEGVAAGRLTFTDEIKAACQEADILWVAHDTPVNDQDEAEVDQVLREVRRCVPALPPGALILISSQLPVGTCRALEREFGPRGYRFACSPENLRLGKSIEVFTQAERIIAGISDEKSRAQLTELFAPFTQRVVWMSRESAEMTKHAINSFLALSITFMNEVARICEVTGADAKEVEQGLKTESRIGPKAYLSPGAAFAGGTLARDVVTMIRLGRLHGQPPELISAIKRSNDLHRLWALQKIQKILPAPEDKIVALLGLTYKPGTDTLRRSSAVELARALAAVRFQVRAFDPACKTVPSELDFISLSPSAADALAGADAVVLCTEWPEFKTAEWTQLIARLRTPIIVDATRFLAGALAGIPGLRYFTVGSPE